MLYDNPQFVAAVRKIINESLRAKPSVDPDQAQQDSYDERDNTPIVTVSELRTEIPIRVETEPEKSKARRIGKTIFGILEVFGIFAVIAYTVLANRQWHEMISARHSAEKAIATAKQSADDALTQAQNNFISDQRPYIWLTDELGPFDQVPQDFSKLSGRLAFTFHVKNFGKSPAIHFQSTGRILFGKNVEQRISFKIQQFDPIQGGILPPGKDAFNTAFSDGPIDAQLLKRIRTPGVVEYVVVAGFIYYTDTSGNIYTSEFCFERNPGLSLTICKTHNQIH